MCLSPTFVQLSFYFSRGVYPCAVSGVCCHTDASLLNRLVMQSYVILQNYFSQWVE